jgi:dimethylargininase
MQTRKVLVRRPGPRLTDGIVTHVKRRPVNHSLALAQWAGYVSALESAGWAPVEVPIDEESPDSVFIEDTVVMYRNVAVITRPGVESRRAETDGVEAVVAELGYALGRIVAPGTLDGGDVLKVGDVVYVGAGGRTNSEGIRQLRAILAPLGATVVGVPVSKVLHLKSAVTALPDGTVIGYEPGVDEPRLFPRFLPVPEESGSHIVVTGDDRLLMSADCPQTFELLRRLGYKPVRVDISEFQKLEGCVTCLSVRLR